MSLTSVISRRELQDGATANQTPNIPRFQLPPFPTSLAAQRPTRRISQVVAAALLAQFPPKIDSSGTKGDSTRLRREQGLFVALRRGFRATLHNFHFARCPIRLWAGWLSPPDSAHNFSELFSHILVFDFSSRFIHHFFI